MRQRRREETVEEGFLQGYSDMLGLFVRWERGELRWHDLEKGLEIPTFKRKLQARMSAEAQDRELEAELLRRDGEG